MGDNTRKRSHEEMEGNAPPSRDEEFENMTFQHPKRKCEECLYCTDPTDQYLDCCQKPICRECFGRLYHEFGETTCPHCREVLFEHSMCYMCKERHPDGIKDRETARTHLQQAIMWFLIKRMIERSNSSEYPDEIESESEEDPPAS